MQSANLSQPKCGLSLDFKSATGGRNAASLRRVLGFLTHLCGFGGRFGQIHFVDSSMQCSPANAEILGSGGHVAIGRGERLHDRSLVPREIVRPASLLQRLRKISGEKDETLGKQNTKTNERKLSNMKQPLHRQTKMISKIHPRENRFICYRNEACYPVRWSLRKLLCQRHRCPRS